MVKNFRLGVSILVVFVSLVFLASALKAQSNTVAELSVHAGAFERVNTPVEASLEGVPLQQQSGALQLYEITGGQETSVASQFEAGSSKRLTCTAIARVMPRPAALLLREFRSRPRGAQTSTPDARAGPRSGEQNECGAQIRSLAPEEGYGSRSWESSSPATK